MIITVLSLHNEPMIMTLLCCMLICLTAYERINGDGASCIARLNITAYKIDFIEERVSIEAMADDRSLIFFPAWFTLSQKTL